MTDGEAQQMRAAKANDPLKSIVAESVKTMMALNGPPPDDAHDDEDGDELQKHAHRMSCWERFALPPETMLKRPSKEDDRDGADGDRDEDIDGVVHTRTGRSDFG